jgi:hypothetical protein
VTKLSDAQQDDFAAYARRPELWLEGSRRHLAVFEILTNRREELFMRSGSSQDESSGCFYGAYLHAGLAVENAVKAWFILKDPEIINAGKIDKDKLPTGSGHVIVRPSERILGPLSKIERDVLYKLEQHVRWIGKYTVPMRAEDLLNLDSLQRLRSAPINERELIRSLVNRLHARVVAESVQSPGR